MNFPENCKYSEDHEWLRVEDGNIAYIGITDFAQDALGEIVYVEIDENDDVIAKGDEFGTIEAVKTTSELFMPVTGKILEINQKIVDSGEDAPEIVNENPYDHGWIIKIEMSDLSELDGLMSADEYKTSIDV